METLFDTLMDIDLGILPPCEHAQHGELVNDAPAAYLLRAFCPGCPDAETLLICDPCYKDGLAGYLECDACGYVGQPSEMWKVIEVL